MLFNIITAFPEIFPGSLIESVTGRAIKSGICSINTVDIKKFTACDNGNIDCKSYGSEHGMIMSPHIVSHAIEHVKIRYEANTFLHLSPKGRLFDQKTAEDLVSKHNVSIICSRFEGIDQRVIDKYNVQEISIGDYVITNGEIAAIIIIDACIRLIDGVIKNVSSIKEESFSVNYPVEYPQYTKPANWNSMKVPEILRSGNHKKISHWRFKKSLEYAIKVRGLSWLKDFYKL